MRQLALLLLLVLLALPLNATKPCPSSPCFDQPSGQFNARKCDAASDWQAVGHIKNLVHHPQGQPLMKDFATFTFVVEQWVRGRDPKVKEIPFTVGWCKNAEKMKSDHGSFMFWGKNKPKVENAEWEYLHFDRTDIPY